MISSARPSAARSGAARPAYRRDPAGDTLGFMRLLWAIDHRLRSISKHMQNRLGITAPQRLALRLVGRSPGVTPSELASSLHLDRGTLTGILERLEARKLLLRKPHPDDGRSVVLRLSARGRSLDRQMSGTVEECIRRALGTLTRAEIETAARVLEAVAQELEAEATADRRSG